MGRFEAALVMLPADAQDEVFARIDAELPERKAPQPRGKGFREHDGMRHKPRRGCDGCRLEILGSVAATLGRIDVLNVAAGRPLDYVAKQYGNGKDDDDDWR